MKWTDYTTKETLEDNDELMTLDADGKANKRTLMSKIWNYVVDKMTSAVVAKLTTTDKTVLGAINELNSKKLLDLNFGSKQELLLYLKNNTSKRFSFYFTTSVSNEMFGIAASMKGLCSPVRTSVSSTGFVYDFLAYGSDNVCIARYDPSTGQVTVKKLNTDTAKVKDVQ